YLFTQLLVDSNGNSQLVVALLTAKRENKNSLLHGRGILSMAGRMAEEPTFVDKSCKYLTDNTPNVWQETASRCPVTPKPFRATQREYIDNRFWVGQTFADQTIEAKGFWEKDNQCTRWSSLCQKQKVRI